MRSLLIKIIRQALRAGKWLAELIDEAAHG